MRRSLRIALALSLVATACSSDLAGPEPPRPTLETTTSAPTATTVTTTPPTTVTTVAPVDCPGEFCLVYRLDPMATWSDGTPITAEDWRRSAQFYRRVPSPEPDDAYRALSSIEVIDEHTISFVFSSPVGNWEELFPRLLPAAFEEVVPGQVGSGPFVLNEWVPGDRIVVTRNPNAPAQDPISGAPAGTVREITFVFVESHDEMLDRLETGEIDVISVRPDVGLVEEVAARSGLDYQLALGRFWEHIDFHHQDPLLSQQWVREVFDLAIDRQRLLDLTVRQYHPDWPALDATAWMGNTFRYRPHYVDRHDPAGAEQILIDQGCETSGAVYTCGETELSFVWGTTSDDPFRQIIFDSVQADLEAVGIEIVPDFRAPSAFVSREFLYGGPEAWQTINFSWRATDDPADAIELYRCEPTDRNVNRFCSEEIDELSRSVDTIAEPDQRAELLHEIDQMYLAQLALIPLYQKPMMMVWQNTLGGPTPNYSVSSDLWNIAAWTGAESIVVALPSEPLSLDPRVTSDDSANAVLATLMYGAFAMTPNHEPVPTLIEGVEVVGG